MSSLAQRLFRWKEALQSAFNRVTANVTTTVPPNVVGDDEVDEVEIPATVLQAFDRAFPPRGNPFPATTAGEDMKVDAVVDWESVSYMAELSRGTYKPSTLPIGTAIIPATSVSPVAFVVPCSSSTHLVIAIRGTRDANDVVIDADLGTDSYHRGMLKAAAYLLEIITPIVNRRHVDSICLTGHSLGGGTAMCAVLVAKLGNVFPGISVKAVTFGAPCILPAVFHPQIGTDILSVVYSEDIVPRLPTPAAWGQYTEHYLHVIPHGEGYRVFERHWSFLKNLGIAGSLADHSSKQYVRACAWIRDDWLKRTNRANSCRKFGGEMLL